MKEVIKFRISLFRERFSIYGWSNILVFVVLATLVIGGIKFFLINAGNYRDIAILISSFMYCFCSGALFNQIDSKKLMVMYLFDKVDIQKYKIYLIYNKYIYFQLIFIYLVFPTSWNDMGFFSFVYVAIQVLLFVTALVFYHGNPHTFSSFKWFSSFAVCLLIFINYKSDIVYMKKIDISLNEAVILLGVSVILIILTVNRCGKKIKNFVHMHKKLPNILFFKNNKDIIYILRTNAMLEPALVVIVSGIASYLLKETGYDMLITNLFSFSYAFSEIYFSLLKYENNSHTFLYHKTYTYKLKKEKIINTLLIVVPILIIVCIPLIFLTSFRSTLFAFIVSCVLFVLNALCFKINLEKENGYKDVVTDKQNFYFLIIYTMEIILICTLGWLITNIL